MASGKCLCGAVSYQAEGISTHVHACHCDMCRRWVGGPNLSAEVQQVEFSGEENITRFASSDWAERGFCSRCGSSLFYQLKGADSYIMCQGSFDDQSGFSLEGEIYVDEKPPGYHFAGEHSRMTGAQFMASIAPPAAQ